MLAFLAGLFILSAGCSEPAGFADDSKEAGSAGALRASTGELLTDFNIVTVLPRDAIRAIDDPDFVTVEEANQVYDDEELILGVEFNGDARAYSIPLLSSHEIVNDTVGGVKLAVTW